jgi:hypothetical protein
MPVTVVKTIGSTGIFSTPQLFEDGAPADLTTSEKSSAGTFLVASFTQGESLSFIGSGATGKFLDTDSTGPGNGTYVTYGLTAGNVATSDVCTGGSSGATCVISSGTPDDTGVVWRGECQNQEFSGASTMVDIVGSGSSSTAYKHLTTVAGASFRDHADAQTNPLRYDATKGCGITQSGASVMTVWLQENFSRASKLQCAATGSDARGLVIYPGDNVRIDNQIIEGTSTSFGALDVAKDGATATRTVTNTIVIQRVSAANAIVRTLNDTSSFYNCTFVAPDDLATAPTAVFSTDAAGTIVVQNCGLFAGDSTKAIKSGTGTPTFTTCYSDISGTAGVTQTTYANEFQNVNDATRDFRLVTGAAQKDTGTTDATNAANDIVGTARPSGAAYDVGAWEFVAAAAVTYSMMGQESM